MPATGKAIRLGISGAPGVGKSTFIEALGNALTQRQQRVAMQVAQQQLSRLNSTSSSLPQVRRKST